MGINIKINKAETPAPALLKISGGDKPMCALLQGNPENMHSCSRMGRPRLPLGRGLGKVMEKVTLVRS